MNDQMPAMPVQDDVSRHYWEGVADRKLLLQSLPGGRLQWPPARFDRETLEPVPLAWEEASGHGRVLTYSVVHKSSYAYPRTPYVLAVIELQEGVCMFTRIETDEPALVHVDAQVALDFEELPSGQVLPVFRLTPS